MGMKSLKWEGIGTKNLFPHTSSHGSRERDGRAWVSESSRAPQGPRSSLHYTTLCRWLGDGRGVATRLVSDCSSRLSRAPGLLCVGNSLAWSVKWLSVQGRSHDFLSGVQSTPLFRMTKSTNHSNMRISTTFETNGIFENLNCQSGCQWHI